MLETRVLKPEVPDRTRVLPAGERRAQATSADVSGRAGSFHA
jgi:hypothetical protein